jgi:Uma2 family endonuclease
MSKGEDSFETYWREHPESKLELIDGRLIVGNGLDASRYILRDILAGWGPEAAIALAPRPLWREALGDAFSRLDPPSPAGGPDRWRRWAERVAFEPAVSPAGPRDTLLHRGARNRLAFDLWNARDSKAWTSLGPDFVLRLGEDGFTPDVFLAGLARLEHLTEYYLDGPPDLVIEVLLPGHESQDRDFKRRRYAERGVPAYWIVDPAARTIDFLRLAAGEYVVETPPAGRRQVPGIPGLIFVPERLWRDLEEAGRHQGRPEASVFETEGPVPAPGRRVRRDGVAWGDLRFDPRPGLEPRALRFEEFISWCGRAKFERVEGKPSIGGSLGTRNVLGMLLRTFGLVEAVSVLHPLRWVTALEATEHEQGRDTARRESWWREVREVVAFLRERFGLGRVAVIGDLARGEPLNVWSDVTLVFWDIPAGVNLSTLYHEIHERNPDTCIADVREYERTTRSQKAETAENAIDV